MAWGGAIRGHALGGEGSLCIRDVIGPGLNKGGILVQLCRLVLGPVGEGRGFVKSVPVGVKPPGRRRTGFRRFWVAVGKRCNLAVCERGRTQRHSDPERDGGHRDHGRCGHRQASCPAAARAYGARCGSGWLHRGEDQTSARAASSAVARERGLWAGVGP